MIIYQCDKCKAQGKEARFLNELKIPGSATKCGATWYICKICLDVVEAFLKGQIIEDKDKE